MKPTPASCLDDGEVSVHALCRSGMPEGVPCARRDRPTHQRDRGFQLGQLHRVRVLHDGLSFRRAQAESNDREGLEVHAVHRSREVGLEPACIKACPTNCLSFGTREDLLRKAEDPWRLLKSDGFATAGVYNPPGVGGTHVLYVLARGDDPEMYGFHVIRRSRGPYGCGRVR